jgi:hypothetical protein
MGHFGRFLTFFSGVKTANFLGLFGLILMLDYFNQYPTGTWIIFVSLFWGLFLAVLTILAT